MGFTEKRKHTRYARNYSVVFSSLDDPFDKENVESFNISLGGIGLLADTPVEVGSKLKLEIENPDGMPVRAEGILRWQRKSNRDPSKYRLGIQFNRVGWTSLKNLLPA